MTTDAADFLRQVSAAPAAGAPLPTDAPPIDSADQKAAYDALAHKLYNGLAGPPDERARSPRGRLASALWQRVAEWDDRLEQD